MQPTSDSFAAFWQLYPRRVAKKSGEKAWSRVATSPEAIEQIMAGLRAQLPQMITREKSFIPHASTWLNGERWKDDYIAAAPYPRIIACEKCADTGVVYCSAALLSTMEPCSCPIGQLPGVPAGVSE